MTNITTAQPKQHKYNTFFFLSDSLLFCCCYLWGSVIDGGQLLLE